MGTVKITKDNAENIARTMVEFRLSGVTESREESCGLNAQAKKEVRKTYTLGGWMFCQDYAAIDSLQKKLRRAIVAVLVEAEVPEGTHVAEARRKYR